MGQSSAGWLAAEHAVVLARGALRAGRSTVLDGGPGTGKTSALERLAALTGSRPRFIRALPALTDTSFGAMLPLIGHSVPIDPNAQGWPRAHEALALAAHELLTGSSGAVLVDDAEHLDAQSAAVVFQAWRSGSPVVLTHRTGSGLPADLHHVAAAELSERSTMTPPSTTEVLELVGPMLPPDVAPPDPSEVARWWALAAGNLHHLCAMVSDFGLVQARRPGEFEVTDGPRVTRAINQWLATLTEGEQSVLEQLACANSVPVELLTPQECSIVNDLHRRGDALLEEVEGRSEAQIASPLFALALAARSRPRHDLLTDPMVGRFARLPPTDRDCVPLVRWSLRTGRVPEADVVARAADRLVENGELDEACRLAEAAHEASRTVAHLMARAETYALAGRYPSVLELLDHLGQSDDAGTSDMERARLGALRIAALTQLRRFHELDETVAMLLGQLGPGPASEYVLAQWGIALAAQGRELEAGERLVALLSSPDPKLRLRAVPAAISRMVHTGRATAAADLCEELLPLASEHARELRQATTWVASSWSFALLASGRLRQLNELVAVSLDASGSQPGWYRGYVLMVQGRCAILEGRMTSAANALGEASELLRDGDNQQRQLWASALHAEALSGCGSPQAQSVWAGIATAQDKRSPYWPDVRRAGAWVTASAGHHHAAASAAIEAAEDAEADGLLAWAVLAYHDAARLNATALAAQRLQRAGSWIRQRADSGNRGSRRRAGPWRSGATGTGRREV